MQAFAACERSLALRVHVTFGERHRGGERCEVWGGAMPCDASATPGGLRCWCRVETKWRWKENNKLGARPD